MPEAEKIMCGATAREHKCPHCGHWNATANSIKLCGGCHVGYKEHWARGRFRATYRAAQQQRKEGE